LGRRIAQITKRLIKNTEKTANTKAEFSELNQKEKTDINIGSTDKDCRRKQNKKFKQ